MKNEKIRDFIEDLGSNSPTPGDGAVAGIVGTVGVTLTSVVYSLTVGKKTCEALSEKNKKKLDENLKNAKKPYNEMLDFMNKDEEAFTTLMDHYKLLKETCEGKNLKSEKTDECTLGAMMVPLGLSRRALKFFDNVRFASKYGNKNLISDTVVSAVILSTCIDSSIVNVKINLGFLEDKNLVRSVKEEILHIRNENNKLKEEILKESGLLQN